MQSSNFVPPPRSEVNESRCSEQSLPVLNDEIVRQSLQNLKLSYNGKTNEQKSHQIPRKGMTKEAKEAKELALSEFYRSKKQLQML
jgi:hypothetical protein